MPAFVPGLELARDYWFDVVAPMLDRHVAAKDRAAALIGEGSDVLGFDTEQSTDNGWGPRVFVFLGDGVRPDTRLSLARVIEEGLPDTFRGYPTKFSVAGEGSSRHQVILTTVGELVGGLMGFDPRQAITAQDWLKTPTHLLRSLTSGASASPAAKPAFFPIATSQTAATTAPKPKQARRRPPVRSPGSSSADSGNDIERSNSNSGTPSQLIGKERVATSVTCGSQPTTSRTIGEVSNDSR